MRGVSIPVPDARVFEELLADADNGVPLPPGVNLASPDGNLLRVVFRIANSLSIPAHGHIVTRGGKRHLELVPGDVAHLRKLIGPGQASVSSSRGESPRPGAAKTVREAAITFDSGGAPTEVMTFTGAERAAASSSLRGRLDAELPTIPTAFAPPGRDLPIDTPPIDVGRGGRDIGTAPTVARQQGDDQTSGRAPGNEASERQMRAVLIGRTLGGKYVIEQPIGSGAMGTVFRGRHVPLGTAVAIKVMRAELASNADFAERFFREAKAATLFEHPGAVRVIDFGEEADKLAYIVTDFVDGRDLATVLANEWPLPTLRVVSIILQVLGVLGKAHDVGLVHRDMKPDNVLLVPHVTDDDEKVNLVKVCDFGIAKLLEGHGFGAASTQLTAQGFIVGTPEYMSPEQARGDAIDTRSDIYSVGVMLFELLTGELPFQGDTVVKVMLGHLTRPVNPPSRRAPNIDPRFDAICLRAMEKDPRNRYASAREMRRALRITFASSDLALGAGSYGELPSPAFDGATTSPKRLEVTFRPPEASVPLALNHSALSRPLARSQLAFSWRAVRSRWALVALALLGVASVWFLVAAR